MLMSEGGWERAVTGACLLLALIHIPLVASFGIPEFLEFGQCRDVYVDPNMNFERYSGIWFVIEQVPNEYSPVDSCSFTNYTWQGDYMAVEERGLNSEGEKVRKSSLMHPTEGQPGVLTVEAEGVPNAPYQIVSTDFDSYACVYSCLSMMGFRASFSWVLARVPTPNESHVALCHSVLEKHGISPSSLEIVKRSDDCPYLEKLDSILAYTQALQEKAKLRAQDEAQRVKVTSEGGDVTQRPQQNSTSDSQDNLNGEEEEELQRDPRRKAITKGQKEERRELLEKVTHHRDNTTAERTITVSGGDRLQLNVITGFLTAAAILVTSCI